MAIKRLVLSAVFLRSVLVLSVDICFSHLLEYYMTVYCQLIVVVVWKKRILYLLFFSLTVMAFIF